MPRYLIDARRTEDVTFAIEATDPQDALQRYLRDGDEVASHTDAFEIIDIEED